MYSHSDSLNNRYPSPVSPDNHRTYSCASTQLTLTTGRFPRPQPSSSGLCEHPPPRRHAPHSSNVTSYTPTAIGSPIVTRCTGPSSSSRPSSPRGLPILYDPVPTTTSSGHPAQSRNRCPGAFSRPSRSRTSASPRNRRADATCRPPGYASIYPSYASTVPRVFAPAYAASSALRASFSLRCASRRSACVRADSSPIATSASDSSALRYPVASNPFSP